MTSKQLRIVAWEKLQGNYGTALVISLISFAIIYVSSISWPFGLLVSGPVMLGVAFSFLKISRSVATEVKDVFWGFEASFVNAFMLALLSSLFTFLWSLLFIIPGIIKYFAYSLAPYLLADNPEMTGLEAISASKELMNGNKGRLFCLYFSFIGWALLACLAFGIGFIFLIPYVEAAKAEFYKSVINGPNANFDGNASDEEEDDEDEDTHDVYL